MKSRIFVFDGTWEGMLTAVFDAFSMKLQPQELVRIGAQLPIFADTIHEVLTDSGHAGRVWKGLTAKLQSEALAALTASFLSEQEEMDMPIFRYIVKVFISQSGIERDFTDSDMLSVFSTARKVRGEKHRVLQFMRFQKAADGTYFGIMEPLYNVMPLTVAHFADRFADQKFILYDKRRGFGYYYDGVRPVEITMPENLNHISTGKLDPDIMDSDERLFQQMWKTYFKAIAIKERMNPRKQRQDMPVRFWKYLVEKQD